MIIEIPKGEGDMGEGAIRDVDKLEATFMHL